MDANNYYWTAVNRNIGLLSEEEQSAVRAKRVAVAGVGAVGGFYLVNLVRMGIGAFNIADLDQYSIANINRQYGATSKTDGRSKVEVMAEIAEDIHPGVKIKKFDEVGITPDNVDEFVEDADVVVDALDYFSLNARRLLHRTARKHGKTVFLSMPMGFSGTLHVFTPDSMSFDEYFDMHDGMSAYDQLVAWTIGLTPWGTHWKYMDMTKVDFPGRAGPSISSAISISAGLVTCEALTVLLGRRPPQAAPRYVQFDPYRMTYRRGRLIMGNRGPLQRVKRAILARKFRHIADQVRG